MILPSKELISEVLSKEVEEERFIDSNSLTYVNSGIYEDINIYELAHKCKEWAKSKHFIDIDSHCDCARWGAKATSHNGRPSVFYEQVFIGSTEPEAIFKACECILSQKKD